MRCENCKYWKERDKQYHTNLEPKGRWGYCSGIPFVYDMRDPFTRTEDTPLNQTFQFWDKMNAYCEDGSGYSAGTVTLESFGCVNFEEKVND